MSGRAFGALDNDVTSDSVRVAMIELITEKRAARGQPVEERETRRLLSFTAYDLGIELCRLMRVEPVVIPSTAEPEACRQCRQAVFWVATHHQTIKSAISIAGEDCRAPIDGRAGVGFSHLVDCPKSALRIKERGTLTPDISTAVAIVRAKAS